MIRRVSQRNKDKVGRSPRESRESDVERTEVQRSPERRKSRGPKSKGGTPNALCTRRETKVESDECKQRPNEVGVGVSNIKTKVIEYIGVILICL